MTDAEVQEWIDALRSGKYKQDNEIGYLRQENRLGDGEISFCCLGVEQEIHNVDNTDPAYLANFAGNSKGYTYHRLPELLQEECAAWNDKAKLSFVQIADKLEEGFSLTK